MKNKKQQYLIVSGLWLLSELTIFTSSFGMLLCALIGALWLWAAYQYLDS